jgi:uronate dehydrogenase
MRQVLLTGSSGGVGRCVRSLLEARGWTVRPFDLVEGCDLWEEGAVRDAMRDCDAVVHAGAIAHDSAGTPAGIVATNVLGTWHVLLAAETHRVARVVYFSSAQVFGFADGEGSPAYLPSTMPNLCERRVPTECRSGWPRRCVKHGLPAPRSQPLCCVRS